MKYGQPHSSFLSERREKYPLKDVLWEFWILTSGRDRGLWQSRKDNGVLRSKFQFREVM
jgi:hypothetical protein